jgi:glutaredoxin
MTDLILFGTEGCHLCEDAEALLLQAGLSFETRDIIDDEQAQQRYAVRIPVLLNSETGKELGWPFDAQQLSEYVR